MKTKLKILHLEDMPTDAELVGRQLGKSDIAFDRLIVDNEADYTRALTDYAPDIILSDHSLPSFNSLEALKILKGTGLKTPFILITATVSEEFAVNVMQAGATDYILKDRLQRLPAAVVNALEKTRLEAEREQAFHELNLLFNTIGETFFSRDVIQQKLIQISPACAHIYGYTREEFLNDPDLWQNLLHPDDKQIFMSHRPQLLQGQKATFQYRIQHKHFGERWVESEVSPLLDNGQLVRIYGVTRDIHERKIAEQRILEVMETQADILNAMPAKVSLLNDRGKIRAVNGSWRKTAIENNLGIPHYGVGYSYFALSPNINETDEENAQKINKGIKDIIARNLTEFSFEYRHNTPGSKRWSQIAAAPLTDQNQHGAVVINIDITAAKLAQESLRQSEANLRSVFENTDLGIVLFDTHFNIISFNSRASAYADTVLNKKIKVGKNGANYFSKKRRAYIKKTFQKALEQEVVVNEASFEGNNGQIEWYETKWFGVRDQHHQNVGVILTINDVTTAKQAEFERGKMTADLLQRNKDLEQFTYIVSHNLRAPLANIIGLINILKDPTTTIDDYAEILNALSTSADNLDKVILDLNQILQAKTQLNSKIEQISLSELVDDVKQAIGHLILRDSVNLSYDFSRIDEIKSLKTYLYSIFYNLIVNSIKYKRADTPPVIQITSEVEDNHIRIIFKDNGRGIDLKRHGEHVFGLYKRFDQTVEGKGMGLFMVKMQAESLGGNVKIQSQSGEGTILTIELPLTQPKPH